VKNSIRVLALCASLLGWVLPAPAQEPPSHRDTSHRHLAQGALALSGFDPVSYFPEGGGRPLPGDPDRTVTHRGVVYRFASEHNAQRFAADPDGFEPAFGGWCAWAMSQGQRVPADPASFRVEYGRLLMFASGSGPTSPRERWAKDDQAPARADARWRESTGEAPHFRAGSHRPDEPRDTSQFLLDKRGLALRGYDPVSYFPAGGTKPAKGEPAREVVYRGVRYRFASDANRDAFKADPEAYEPAYGGWCATAMCKGEKVEIDPAAFRVTDGRLFLFYTGLFADARKDWTKDEPANIRTADDQWRRLSGR
jgi:YHS domain-containing protein